MGKAVQRRLAKAGPIVFSVFAITAAFTAYFSMYAFRKPFAAGTYAGFTFGPLDLKDALIISQVIGYALSKWLGVKYVSELKPERRAIGLVGLILFAWLALVLFAIVPPSARVPCMFLNGLPLGAVWGLVFGFLEGRRTSEILGAGLSASYIVASGEVKRIGLELTHASKVLETGHGTMVFETGWVSEAWMPAMTGAIFLPIFLLAVWALTQIPGPTSEDESLRQKREPMDGAQRKAFFKSFLGGLIALTALYFFLTALRDFRDNYSVEIWAELGFADKPSQLAISERYVAFGVMVALALLYAVKDNRKGLLAAHVIMFAGVIIIGVSTLMFDAGMLAPMPWMVGVGLGLYLAYVPFGCVLFDRMIAATGVVGTAVFMIYVTDAAGYIGSIGLILYKHFGYSSMSKLDFFRYFSYFTAFFCAGCFVYSALYFARRSRDETKLPPPELPPKAKVV